MKKIVQLCSLLILLTALFCCCDPPLKEKEIDDKQSVSSMRSIYVSGAVENDGFFDVDESADYRILSERAGALPSTYVSVDLSAIISADVDTVIFDFSVDGQRYYSVNVNGLYVVYRLDVEGVSADVVNRLADYIEQNGKITNRKDMQDALGDFYQDNYFKFYIDRSDYAQSD